MKSRTTRLDPDRLDLTHVALFLGLRANELIVQQGKAGGFGDFRESYGFVIQHLIESDRTITELAERMEVTQQAASKVVAEMIARGVLEWKRGDDRRAKWIRLSARGWNGVQFARRARQRIDRRLRTAVGATRYASAKRVILDCLNELGEIERIRTRRIRQPL